MTWDAYRRRGEVLRAVTDEANSRPDGTLPMNLAGVAETFGDELALVGALLMRWHTRLDGTIERALLERPFDTESAVVDAWSRTATDLAGVREILDACTESPASDAMEEVLDKARASDWRLLAATAGVASASGPDALRAGRRIEQRARAAHRPGPVPAACEPRHRAREGAGNDSLLSRLKARLAA
jgi:hypothetical protein